MTGLPPTSNAPASPALPAHPLLAASRTSEPAAQAILDFWFGPLAPDGTVAADRQAQWFKKDPDFDAAIKKRYGEYANLAFMGAFDRWTKEPAGTAALMVLLDQFPRHIFRGGERAFAYDKKALATCWAALDAGMHLRVPAVLAYFIVMPTMHAEFLNVQERGITEFQAVLAAALPHERPLIEEALRYAAAHRDIIARFHRFPHRNAAMLRESTAEEAAFLLEPGSSF